MTTWVSALQCVVGVALVTLPSQATAQHDDVARALRDSLARIESVDDLRKLERQATLAVRGTTRDRVNDRRLAFVTLRLAEANASVVDFERAIGRFDALVVADSASPAVWLGLGLAHLGYGRTANGLVVAVGDLVGSSPTDRAANAFAHGIAVDSSLELVTSLVRVAVQHRVPARAEATLTAVRRGVPLAPGQRIEALLARAQIERAAGSLDSALIAIEMAARTSRDPLILLELGHTRLVMGRLDGVAPWYDGLARAKAEALAQYRRDLVNVLPDTLFRQFDAVAPNGRVALMRTYWNAQDPDGLSAHAERLLEHYRRLDLARRDFPLADSSAATDRFADFTDDRGRIVVLHGPPAERAILSGLIGLPPSESWSYRGPGDSTMVFHFLADREGAPFHRVESVLDILARSNQARWFSGRVDASGRDTASTPVNTYGAELSAIIAQQVLLSRWNVSDIYRQMLAKGKGGAEAMQVGERELGQASLARTATWALDYELPLDAKVGVLAAGLDARGPKVQVGFAIAGRALAPVRTPSGQAYQVRLRASVRDLQGNVVASWDTTRTFLARNAIRPEAYLLGRVALAVPSGTFVMRIALDHGGRGMITSRDTITVSAAGTEQLGLSDLVLGARSVPLSFRTIQGDTAWINPLMSFRVGELMQLHFEVTGLEAGARFRTDLRVIRQAGGGVLGLGGPATLTLGFDEAHGGGIRHIQREIDPRRLRPGDYVIEVTVSTPAGQRTTRQQEFVIVK